MTEAVWKIFTGYGSPIEVKKDTVLGGSNAEFVSNYIYLLEEGICALTSFTQQGEEKIYLYFHPRRVIAFNQLMVSGRRRSIPGPEFSIISKTACLLYRIPCEVFLNLVSENQDFNAFLIETLADNYEEALVHFHLMQEESVTSRLCRLLLEISIQKNGSLVVPKFFTYAELSKYLGSHPVTVSRIMAKMKRCGYLTKTSLGIAVEQPEALLELINSESHFKY